MGLSGDALKKRIKYWINNGIIRESGKNVYSLVDSPIDPSEGRLGLEILLLAIGATEEEDSNAVASAQEQQEETFKIYESYVIGMLRTFNQMPLDKLHNNLKLFAASDNYNLSIQQCSDFLNRLVKDDKLEFAVGMYSIKK